MRAEKRCKRCDTLKLVTAFGQDTSRPDGLSFYCKHCRCTMQRESHHRKVNNLAPARMVRVRFERYATQVAERFVDHQFGRINVQELLRDVLCLFRLYACSDAPATTTVSQIDPSSSSSKPHNSGGG